jgi:hypothetical protein
MCQIRIQRQERDPDPEREDKWGIRIRDPDQSKR